MGRPRKEPRINPLTGRPLEEDLPKAKPPQVRTHHSDKFDGTEDCFRKMFPDGATVKYDDGRTGRVSYPDPNGLLARPLSYFYRLGQVPVKLDSKHCDQGGFRGDIDFPHMDSFKIVKKAPKQEQVVACYDGEDEGREVVIGDLVSLKSRPAKHYYKGQPTPIAPTDPGVSKSDLEHYSTHHDKFRVRQIHANGKIRIMLTSNDLRKEQLRVPASDLVFHEHENS